MSDSLSSAERDARIARIENLWECGCRGCELEISEKGHHAWLLAELRSAFAREAALDDALDYERRKDRSEAVKDAGRMDYLEAHLERLTVTRFAEPVGGRSVVVGLSHSPSPNILAGAGGDSIREAADRAMSFSARSVSLSENG